MDVNFTLTSVNVRGIRDATKRARVFEWCKEKKVTLFFFRKHIVLKTLRKNGSQSGVAKESSVTAQIIAKA